MPPWARYACAIYFGLMMSGALAPPEWGVASGPPQKTGGLAHNKPAIEKYAPPNVGKARPSATDAADAAAVAAPPALPADSDLLR